MKIKFYSDGFNYDDFLKLDKNEPLLYRGKIYWDDPVFKEFSNFCFVKEFNSEIIYLIQDFYFTARANVETYNGAFDTECEIIMEKQIFDVSLEFINRYGIEALKYVEQNHRWHSLSDFNRYITHESAKLISNGLL